MSDTIPVTFAAYPITELDDRWRELGEAAGGNPHWQPLAIKITYVLGVIHDICESVDWLLKAPNAWPVTYISAFGVCASGIELFGRCIEGDADPRGHSTRNLRRGFNTLLQAWPREAKLRSGIVTRTLIHAYTIEDLVTLRNFSAHGQATAKDLGIVDNELLEAFPKLIGNAMEWYWNELQKNTALCERMAQANILPLMPRSAPLVKMWKFFQEDGKSVRDTFEQFNWRITDNGRQGSSL